MCRCWCSSPVHNARTHTHTRNTHTHTKIIIKNSILPLLCWCRCPVPLPAGAAWDSPDSGVLRGEISAVKAIYPRAQCYRLVRHVPLEFLCCLIFLISGSSLSQSGEYYSINVYLLISTQRKYGLNMFAKQFYKKRCGECSSFKIKNSLGLLIGLLSWQIDVLCVINPFF